MQRKNPPVASREIGKRMKTRRRQLRLSQEDLAVLLDVTYQQIQRYESGVNKLNVENLQLVADELNVPVTYFFGPERPAAIAESAAPYHSQTQAEKTLLKHFRKIRDRSDRNIVMKVARLAAKRTK